MRKTVENLMRQYGSYVRIGDGAEGRMVKAFFQSVNSASLRSIESVVSPLGEISRGLYVYIGPMSAEVKEGELLMLGTKRFRFRKVEPCYFADSPIYQWGLCIEKGEMDTWGS